MVAEAARLLKVCEPAPAVTARVPTLAPVALSVTAVAEVGPVSAKLVPVRLVVAVPISITPAAAVEPRPVAATLAKPTTEPALVPVMVSTTSWVASAVVPSDSTT